jgi:hypothetical protein
MRVHPAKRILVAIALLLIAGALVYPSMIEAFEVERCLRKNGTYSYATKLCDHLSRTHRPSAKR